MYNFQSLIQKLANETANISTVVRRLSKHQLPKRALCPPPQHFHYSA